MSSSIVPLSQVSREEATSYLVGQGQSPEIIAWKYFDEKFNRGRSRGWVWQKDGRVQGFAGLFPFALARGARRLDIQWLCDWSVGDYSSNKGVGVRLFKRAVEASTHMVCLSGNDLSLDILDRMASRTLTGADIQMRLFLRADSLLERAEQRLPPARLARRTPLKYLPLHRAPAPDTSGLLSTTPGISEILRPLLEAAEPDAWRAVYDFDYVDWQIGRCPILESWTVLYGADEPRAGAVLWRLKDSAATWRAVVWVRPASLAQAQPAARAVVEACVSQAMAQGGTSFSVVTSKWDRLLLGVLRNAGLRPTREQRPVFVFDTPQSEIQIDHIRGLNFLSTDIAYR